MESKPWYKKWYWLPVTGIFLILAAIFGRKSHARGGGGPG